MFDMWQCVDKSICLMKYHIMQFDKKYCFSTRLLITWTQNSTQLKPYAKAMKHSCKQLSRHETYSLTMQENEMKSLKRWDPSPVKPPIFAASLRHTRNTIMGMLTLKVLYFWKFTSYCSLKPLWSGMGEVVPARTSPTLHPPSPPTVHQLS